VRAAQALGKLTALLKPLGATTVQPGAAGADVGPLVEKGVPGMLLLVDESRYFDYHHSAADTLDKVDPAALTEATAAMAAMGWLLAEMPTRLDALPARPAGRTTGKPARPTRR
jgi:carboxypeptidase Q